MWAICAGFLALTSFLIFYFTGFDNTDFTKVKIAFNHFQVSAIIHSFTLRWPKLFVEIAHWFIRILSFDFLSLSSPECSTGSLGYFERWSLAMVTPLVLIAPFAYAATHFDWFKTRMVCTVAALASITFIWGVSTCLEVWACSKDDFTGNMVLDADPSVECSWDNPIYARLLPLSVVGFAVYFVGFLVGLSEAAASDDVLIISSVAPGFRPEAGHLWVFLINIYKFLAAVASIFLRAEPVKQCVMMMVVAFAMMLATKLTEPYEDDTDTLYDSALHALELFMLLVIFLLYLALLSETGANILLFTALGFSLLLLLALSLSVYFQIRLCDNKFDRSKKQSRFVQEISVRLPPRSRVGRTFSVTLPDGTKITGVHPRNKAPGDVVKVKVRKESDGDDDGADAEAIEVGARVEARFRGGKHFFSGKVRQVNRDGSYDVQYDLGDVESGVPRALIRTAKDQRERRPSKRPSLGDTMLRRFSRGGTGGARGEDDAEGPGELHVSISRQDRDRLSTLAGEAAAAAAPRRISSNESGGRYHTSEKAAAAATKGGVEDASGSLQQQEQGEVKVDPSTSIVEKGSLEQCKKSSEKDGGDGDGTDEEAGVVPAFPGGIEDFLSNMQIQTNWDYLGVQI